MTDSGGQLSLAHVKHSGLAQKNRDAHILFSLPYSFLKMMSGHDCHQSLQQSKECIDIDVDWYWKFKYRAEIKPCVENLITKLRILQKNEKRLEAGIQLVVQDRKVVARFWTRKESNETRHGQKDGVKKERKQGMNVLQLTFILPETTKFQL